MNFDKPVEQNRGDAAGSATLQALLLDAQSYKGPRAINVTSDNVTDRSSRHSGALDFDAHPIAGYEAEPRSTRLQNVGDHGDGKPDRRSSDDDWHKSYHSLGDENEHLVNKMFKDDPDLGKVALRYLRVREGLDTYPTEADKNADMLALRAYGEAQGKPFGFDFDTVGTLNNAADRLAKEERRLEGRI